MNTRSLRFQLSAWYALLFTTVFLCFGFFICAAVKHFLHNNLRSTLVRRAHQMDDLLRSQLPLEKSALAGEIAIRFAPETSGRFIRVADISEPDSKILYISGIPKDARFDPAEVSSVIPIICETARVETLLDGRQMMIDALPWTNGRLKYLVEVGSSLSPINAVLHQVNRTMLTAGPIVILVAILGAYLLVGRALTPVDTLARGAERITLHNLNERLPVSNSGDELETLALALNKMISRLHESFDYTRRFIADASHELRTPLTVMRAEMETILRSETTSPPVQDCVASTLEEVDRLAVIVDGLLSLSLLDAGGAQSEAVRLDLSRLASSVTEQMGLVAEDKGINLRPECATPVPVEGDRSRLKQVLVNLLDNAIKYTPSGGKVIVRTRTAGDRAILEVIDSGMGIPSKICPSYLSVFSALIKLARVMPAALDSDFPLSSPFARLTQELWKQKAGPAREAVFAFHCHWHQTHLEETMNVPNSSTSNDTPIPARRLLTPGRCAALIIAITLAVIFIRSSRSKPAAAAASISTVATTKVGRGSIWRELTIDAEFRPYQEVDLHAKVSGYVQSINVDVGDLVKEGDAIGTLEIPELEADLEHAEAVSRRSQEEVKEAQANFDDARLTLTRLNAVQKARPNLVAQQDIDAANAKDQAMAANLGAAREQAAVAVSDVKKLKVMQTYARIEAPFTGVITKRYADKGALIQAGTSSSTQAMPLVRLSQNNRLRLVFPVSVSYVAQIKPGEEVQIEVPALARSFKGKITRITDKIEFATRSMDAEVDLDNPDLLIIPGMYASVSLTLDRKNNALVLPIEAVSRGKSATVMFVAPNGVLEERTIQPGLEMPAKIEILSGLKEGDQVLVGSRALVHSGQQVIAKPVTMTAQAQ